MSANPNCFPPSIFPKPGEEVVYFSKNKIIEGKLLGYDIYEKPVIINQFDFPDSTNSFEIIRAKYPNNRIGPNWERLPESGIVEAANTDLADMITKKLEERIPPGPNYMELIQEFYYRGYETYLVGGTVRDFIQGEKSNDIDLVTTMPLKWALPLIRSMFNDKFSYARQHGYIRIGGTPASGDPFIDVKNFSLSNAGYGTSLFGSELADDFKIRDFACNAIYYEPINKLLIDPSGSGICDARAKKLSIVRDLNIHAAHYSSAQILVRFVKFAARGYTPTDQALVELRANFCPLFSTMDNASRIEYVRRQILSKSPLAQRTLVYENFVQSMIGLGFEYEYEQFIKPFESYLNLN